LFPILEASVKEKVADLVGYGEEPVFTNNCSQKIDGMMLLLKG